MISTSKNSDKRTESLLFPVAVAHRIITIQSGCCLRKFVISSLACATMFSISITNELNVKRIMDNGRNVAH